MWLRAVVVTVLTCALWWFNFAKENRGFSVDRALHVFP